MKPQLIELIDLSTTQEKQTLLSLEARLKDVNLTPTSSSSSPTHSNTETVIQSKNFKDSQFSSSSSSFSCC